jgi:hypothetical protein
MNKLFASHLLCLAVAVGTATQAFGSLTLTKFDSNYLGMVEGQPRSTNPTNEALNINDLRVLAIGQDVGSFNRLGSTLAGSPFVAATAVDSIKPALPGEVGGKYTFNLTTAFQYIYAKYDGPNYGSLVWFFPNGISGEISIPKYPSDAGTQYGLSHMSAYNPVDGAVPEPASLLAWGGLAMTGVAVSLLRRKLKK